MNIDEYLNIHSPGYVIEVYNNGTLNEYTYGFKSIIPNKEKVESNTIYDIASLTKLFTTTLIYIAYEEKLLDINSYIYDIDSNFINLKDVTILDLIKHNQSIWTDGYLGDSKDYDDFNRMLYSSYVKSKERTYLDVHYMILSKILEKVYDDTYNNICKNKIIDKLNMRDTTFNPDPNRCASCNFEHINDTIIDYIYPGTIHDTKARVARKYGIYTGHAGLFSTGHDLFIFLKSFLDNTLLTKETISFMLQHDDINKSNYELLKKYNEDISKAFLSLDENTKKTIFNTYNNMGTRYKNDIILNNDVPYSASDNTITFSGYTGPMITIDFDNRIIIIVMCNIVHNNTLSRNERKRITFKIIDTIYNDIKKSTL